MANTHSDGHGGHDAHGHDAHDSHGGHGAAGGHGHDDAPQRTLVPPWEPTPWAGIVIGIVVVVIVYFVGMQRNWPDVVKNNPGSKLGVTGQPAVQK
ncbi:MAG: hypothetical protein ACKVS6_00900 [Planctomycetota bacterium]